VSFNGEPPADVVVVLEAATGLLVNELDRAHAATFFGAGAGSGTGGVLHAVELDDVANSVTAGAAARPAVAIAIVLVSEQPLRQPRSSSG